MGETETQILEAAKKVFLEKGYAGARMQEIADEAGINKAMLHYYYRNKVQLFEVIFTQALNAFLPRFKSLLASDLSVEEKVRIFVSTYIGTIRAWPGLPLFILHELNQRPEAFVQTISNHKDFPDIRSFLVQILEEQAAGNLRPVQPVHLLVHIISLCVFPFVGKPMLKAVAKMDEAAFDAFLDQRVEEVTDFILHAIKPAKT